jgi:hypothetical protein
LQKMDDFFNTFQIPQLARDLVLESEFTVIKTLADEEKETPIPPQEVPIEE